MNLNAEQLHEMVGLLKEKGIKPAIIDGDEYYIIDATQALEDAHIALEILKDRLTDASKIRMKLAGDNAILRTQLERAEGDAKRMRWMLAGNGYFMEEQGICGHWPCSEREQNEARVQIDEAIIEHEEWCQSQALTKEQP